MMAANIRYTLFICINRLLRGGTLTVLIKVMAVYQTRSCMDQRSTVILLYNNMYTIIQLRTLMQLLFMTKFVHVYNCVNILSVILMLQSLTIMHELNRQIKYTPFVQKQISFHRLYIRTLHIQFTCNINSQQHCPSI